MCQILSMYHRGRFYTANEMFLDYVELRQSNFAVKNERVLRIRQKKMEIEVGTDRCRRKGGLNKKRKRKSFLCFRKGEVLYKKNLVNLISCYLCSIQYPRHLV